MKIGYSFWGFLGDNKIKDGKEVSTPDGNAFYSWSIINALVDRGHKVYRMMPDRDKEAVEMFGVDNFKAFAKDKRYRAYKSLIDEIPNDLDVLLLEWRFPIPGRNCEIEKDNPAYQPDLDIQNMLLEKYGNTKTKIIIFDLDYKLTLEDELKVMPHAVIETSLLPKQRYSRRYPVFIPFDFEVINEMPIERAVKEKAITYVGNRYERDNMIDKYLAPLQGKISIQLYGNWLEASRDSDKKWPGFKFNPRISMKDFRSALGDAGVVPLLAKDEYLKHGFMTARIIEAVFFGAVPVSFEEFHGIDVFLPDYLIADSSDRLKSIANRIVSDPMMKYSYIQVLRNRLKFMDSKNFVITLEKIVKEEIQDVF